jgi:signal transduction histidine kinase
MKEIRYPLNKGVAGYVYMNQRPVIIHNTNDSPLFYKKVDQIVGYETRNMIEVPIRTTERTIGVLGAVNKKKGHFDKNDEELLGAIASMAALPLENARINEELNQSYEAVKSMNRAKERVLHHLSHELKTPVSVLGASLKLLFRKPAINDDPESISIIRRAQRNLDRLLEMQYGIEDILHQRDYRSYHMLTSLLEACTDELESLVAEETGEGEIVKRIRNKIENIFGPHESEPETVLLDQFVEKKLTELQPLFRHRQCIIIANISDTSPIFIPPDALSKIVEGLLRNAVENTPDRGRIAITVRERKEGPELEITDYGVGITEENRKLMFESHVSTRDTMQYSSKKPYDFNAGGKGFDLLRMKIFSDRYRFHIALHSKRCIYIPTDRDVCPGDIDKCEHCQIDTDCIDSGGTSVNVRFYRHPGSES